MLIAYELFYPLTFILSFFKISFGLIFLISQISCISIDGILVFYSISLRLLYKIDIPGNICFYGEISG